MYNAERLRLKRPLIHSKVRLTQIAIWLGPYQMSGSTSIMGQDYSADCQCYSNYHLFKANFLEPDIT